MEQTSYRIEKLNDHGKMKDAISLIRNGFMECIAATCAPMGVKTFFDYTSETAIKKRQEEGAFWLVALQEDKLIGALEMRKHHISLLFVEKMWRHKGVARALFNKARHNGLEKFGKGILTVHAALNAVDVYTCLGFQPYSGEQESGGMRFIAMKMGDMDF